MKSVPIMQNNRTTKRKRGGQKHNQYARKHGFYSTNLTHEEICRFWNITSQEGIEPEIAVLRIKLRNLLEQDPGNRRVLKEASKSLAKWFRMKYRLSRIESGLLKRFIAGILENHPPRQTASTEQLAPSEAQGFILSGA